MDLVEVARGVVEAKDVVAAQELVVREAEALAVLGGGIGPGVRVLAVDDPRLVLGHAVDDLRRPRLTAR